jgi:alkylation response protein AidB-like acyl-CoA dehydrogenase
MDFSDTPQEAAFRAEARAFLQAHEDLLKTPETPLTEAQSLARAKAWQKVKQQHGWAVLSWPKEYGGRGATPMEQIIWNQEESKYDAPTGPFAIGLGMCGPTLIAYGTEEQKRARLPRMASGEDIWCQLFSEPAGGSDLAALRTRAERDGNDWIVNGQKIWTSGAHYSDWGILVTRTDPNVPKHKGLTFFIVDMHSSGIEARPIKQISGGADFNEVYFTNVRIPDSQRLGEVGQGWQVALTTLMNERLAVGNAGGPDVKELMELAQRVEIDGKPALEHGAVRDKLADWYCQASGLKFTNYRVLSALSRGQTPGPENSITKVVSANKLQQISSFAMDLMDMGGVLTADNPYAYGYMFAPGYRIAGGTDEILRNIIAERVLGLPQDVRVDKNVPFNQVPTGR